MQLYSDLLELLKLKSLNVKSLAIFMALLAFIRQMYFGRTATHYFQTQIFRSNSSNCSLFDTYSIFRYCVVLILCVVMCLSVIFYAHYYVYPWCMFLSRYNWMLLRLCVWNDIFSDTFFVEQRTFQFQCFRALPMFTSGYEAVRRECGRLGCVRMCWCCAHSSAGEQASEPPARFDIEPGWEDFQHGTASIESCRGTAASHLWLPTSHATDRRRVPQFSRSCWPGCTVPWSEDGYLLWRHRAESKVCIMVGNRKH